MSSPSGCMLCGCLLSGSRAIIVCTLLRVASFLSVAGFFDVFSFPGVWDVCQGLAGLLQGKCLGCRQSEPPGVCYGRGITGPARVFCFNSKAGAGHDE